MATNLPGIISSALKPDVTPIPLDPTQQAQPTSVTAPTGTTTQVGPATPATPAPTGYNPTNVATPTPWNVTDNQTVAGQVKSLIDDNGPLIQQARTNAKMAANDRGLVNSSMAVQAGEGAAYQAALPIAQADAATYGKASGYNADQINQANTQNAQFGNAASQFNAKAINDVGLQQIANENQKVLQSNSQAVNLMNQATGVINNIMMNDKMDSNAKTESARQIYENLRTQLSILSRTSGLDLSSLLMENPYDSQAVPSTPEAPPEGPHSDALTNLAAWGDARGLNPTGILNPIAPGFKLPGF